MIKTEDIAGHVISYRDETLGADIRVIRDPEGCMVYEPLTAKGCHALLQVSESLGWDGITRQTPKFRRALENIGLRFELASTFEGVVGAPDTDKGWRG